MAAALFSFASPMSAQRPAYPPTRAVDVTDDLHGVRVADPYRWLEDLGSTETGAWVDAQNAVTNQWLARTPRADWSQRLTSLWNSPRVSVPQRLRNGVLFYQRNSGLQRQAEVVAQSSPDTPPRVVIDPAMISPDGSVALAQFSPAPDARHVAYGLAVGGADWEDIHIRRVRDGVDLPDTLRWVRFSNLSWTRDGRGFFYSRFPARDSSTRLSDALEHHRLYYHRLGTPQAEDVLVFERPAQPQWFVHATTSEDGRYLFIYSTAGADTRNRLAVVDLVDSLRPQVSRAPQLLVDVDDAEYTVIGNSGRTVYVRTDLDAPRRRLIAIDLDRPQRAAWRTVIPEGPHAMGEVAMTSTGFVVNRLVDVASELSLHARDGRRTGTVPLPSLGTVTALSASSQVASFYYAFSAPLVPTNVFRYDARARKSVTFHVAATRLDASQYQTQRIFATSADGTRVPLFVTARRDTPRDGTAPTVLYAYGGFGIAVPPTWSAAAAAWLDRGGVWVTANLRGGSEYGEAWHRAGMRGNKQRVFDDFIAAAQQLVADRWTAPAHLAIMGGSNGGLLVGAVMTQRPELFAAALPQVGVLDMLRYHRFTGGAAWANEYGAADDPEAFRWLHAYSPLHRLVPGTCYPATMVTTADHDDRVVPSHSYKFAAALQAAQGCDRPVLLRTERDGSHGYRPTDRQIAEYADLWAFAWAATGGAR
ncbi:MAG: S9 family peptidase [Gemmatimonadetes bacterium]|nr:S9 family peptidase [Gemmatimonadota bacterium]